MSVRTVFTLPVPLLDNIMLASVTVVDILLSTMFILLLVKISEVTVRLLLIPFAVRVPTVRSLTILRLSLN